MLIFDSNYVGWNSATAILKGLNKGLSYKGERTEVIYQFVKRILELSKRFESQQVVFCWDSPNNKRKDIYPTYKANRHNNEEQTEEAEESFDNIFRQFQEIKEFVLPELGFSNVFEVNGFESDDLIAKIVQHYNQENTVIISSDEDLYQLLNENCSIYSITKKQTMTEEVFKRHYGITPKQWIDVKAIGGCHSDNVKGVGGVAEKKSIDYLTGKLNKGQTFLHIKNSQDIIDRNIRLVKLPFEGTPLPRIRNDQTTLSKFKDICKEFGFQSLLDEKTYSLWQTYICRKK